MTPRTNADRADDAMAALQTYPAADPLDLHVSITDLMADLLHLAEREGVDPNIAVERAELHFHAEGGDGHEPEVTR